MANLYCFWNHKTKLEVCYVTKNYKMVKLGIVKLYCFWNYGNK